MSEMDSTYNLIKNKIHGLKEVSPSLRDKSDPFLFSILAIKSNFFKNPALNFSDNDFLEMIVDGQHDGGVDFILTDPNSENCDLVIGQSKFYTTITIENINDAMSKMATFYKDMISGHYESINEKVQCRFFSLNSELGEESKINFVFYTSAPANRIRKDTIKRKFLEHFQDSSKFNVHILFGSDIEEEIKESESRRPTVESGKIIIDKSDNILYYDECAVMVNVSAFSIKELYSRHNKNLLSRNLRYHIKGADIDKAIATTINENPETFWLKNNGLTIICDEFEISGKHVKLINFSIVNGGQTTYMIHRNNNIDQNHDFFVPCKIIKIEGNSEDEKNQLSLEIAKATNSQKAIKAVDLKANSPEQVRFVQAMREAGIFYQTKRGEIVPKTHKEAHKNTDLWEVGKLCLAAIFQLPCKSRSKPSILYSEQYYNIIFNSDQIKIAKIAKELLYIDYYFRNKFIKKFDSENANNATKDTMIPFAHNARTICIAFVALASRFYRNNITNNDISKIFNCKNQDSLDEISFDIFKRLEGFDSILPNDIFDMEKYDETLNNLFNLLINFGTATFTQDNENDSTLNATNYLKKDVNYYRILKIHWNMISPRIIEIFNEL